MGLPWSNLVVQHCMGQYRAFITRIKFGPKRSRWSKYSTKYAKIVEMGRTQGGYATHLGPLVTRVVPFGQKLTLLWDP
jgi:hypothetical protein